MSSEAVILVENANQTLVGEAVSRIVTELVGSDDRSLVVEDHGGEEVDLAAVADACATPPFLAGRRVVVVRDIGRWSSEEVAPLLAYLEDPLPTTALVLVGGGGTTSTRLVAAVKAKGRVVSPSVDSRRADDWVREQLSSHGLHLGRDAAERLRQHLGEDVSRLVPLISVLTSVYGEGARLQSADLEPYLGAAGSVTPWALTDAIDSGDTARSLELLHRLLDGGDRHPLVVLAILNRHVQSLLKVDSPLGLTEQQAAAAMGIASGRSTFPAKKALRSARQWGSAGIAEAVSLLAEAEVDVKGGSSWPAEAVLEVLAGRLCRLARTRTSVTPRAAGI